MTHSLYLSIIGAVVFIAAYIILRLLRDNERLIAELDEAKAEVRTLDADLDEARRSHREANQIAKNVRMQYKAYRGKTNEEMTKLINQKDKAEDEAEGYKVLFNSLDAEHRQTIQHLYGRIGAMQKQLNRLKNQK